MMHNTELDTENPVRVARSERSGQAVPNRPRVSSVNLPLKWSAESELPLSDSCEIDDELPATNGWLNETFSSIPLESNFGRTLRTMEWRAFRRSYLGSHKRDWQKITAVFLGLFSNMITYTIHNVACTTSRYRLVFLIFLGIELLEAFWLFLIVKTPLALKLFCYCSLTLILINFTLLLAIVNFVQPRENDNESNHHFRLYSLDLSCEADKRSILIYYLLILFFILEVIILICDFIWGHIFSRIGNYYYNKSNLFLKGWKLSSVKYSKILTPVTSTFSDGHISTTSEKQRFKVVRGVHVEYRVVSLIERFYTSVKRIVLCGSKDNQIDLFDSHRQYRGRARYTGVVNAQGQPHGFGYWEGDLVDGECLIGFWADGIPAGPYKSRERSGSGFMCLSIGWIEYQKEKPLKFGKGHLECSVSGQFFKGFPEARLIDAPVCIVSRGKGLLHDARKRLEAMYQLTKTAVIGSNKDSKSLPPMKHQSLTLAPIPELQRNDSLAYKNRSMSTQHPAGSNIIMLSVESLEDDASIKIGHDDKNENLSDSRLYSRSVEWILNELHPHTPNFGIQPRSEIIISVDPERGLDIMGYVPLALIHKHGDSKQRSSDDDPSRIGELDTSETKQKDRAILSVRVQEEPILKVRSDSNFKRTELFVPELYIDGWMPMENVGAAEILFYIHGYNNSLTESMKMLGQMAAFGNFPSHLKIVVFSWPAGRGLLSFNFAKGMAETTAAHDALFDAFASLKANGIKQVHILCHSMGSRLFLKSFRRVEEKNDMFSIIKRTEDDDKEVLYQEHSDADTMELLTCTFLNPEYALDDFLDKDYEILRQRCSCITIYADGNDQALWWSELFSRKEALGRSVFGMRLNRGSGSHGTLFPNPSPHRPTIEDQSAGGAGTDQPSGPDVLGLKVIEQKKLRLKCLHTMSFFQVEDSGNEGDARVSLAAPEIRRRHRRWGFHHRRNRPKSCGEWLDVDIIDTTYMDQNVHGLRHSFWNLNREVIEDLREILVTRKRARQRAGRLDRREGNVWVFRVAPSFLTSIFS